MEGQPTPQLSLEQIKQEVIGLESSFEKMRNEVVKTFRAEGKSERYKELLNEWMDEVEKIADSKVKRVANRVVVGITQVKLYMELGLIKESWEALNRVDDCVYQASLQGDPIGELGILQNAINGMFEELDSMTPKQISE